jgi:hypothetical protein
MWHKRRFFRIHLKSIPEKSAKKVINERANQQRNLFLKVSAYSIYNSTPITDSNHCQPFFEFNLRNDSLIIVAGSKSMIPGIIEAVEVLHKGEKARVIIPYQLGFGEAGHPPIIPPKASLIFDMHIIDVKKGSLPDSTPDK